MQHRLLYATSTIADGNMGFRFGDQVGVAANRRCFLSRNGADYNNCICMACDHGEKITAIDWSTGVGHFGVEKPEGTIESEVLVTNETGIVLMLLTADCIPGIFFDPKRGVIALAHLNRKTIAHNLAQNTVRVLCEEFGSDPADLVIHFGPHIAKASYSFPLPLTEETPPQLAPYIEKCDGYAYIDMVGAERTELATIGIAGSQITVSDIDTATSLEHFSHYRSKNDPRYPEGRLATIAALL